MTDVVSDEKAVADLDAAKRPPSVASDELVRQLAERARAEGLRLTGEGGLLSQLTKVVVESALDGGLDDHLGYGRHDPAGRDGGNSRNGKRGKTILTEAGPVSVEVPRDREGETHWFRWRLGLLDFDQGLVGPFCSVEDGFELCGRYGPPPKS